MTTNEGVLDYTPPLAQVKMLMRDYLVNCPIPKLDLDLGFGPNTETWFRSYNNFACLV